MINIEKWRVQHKIPLASFSRLLQKSRGRVSNIEKGHRAVNDKEVKKLMILDECAARLSESRQMQLEPFIVQDDKLKKKLKLDKQSLREILGKIERIDERIHPLAQLYMYLETLAEHTIISNTKEYEYEHRKTKELLEDLYLKKQYLLIEKAAISAAIDINTLYNQ